MRKIDFENALAPLYALSGFSLVPAALLASLYLLSRFAASPSFNQPP